MAKQDYYETLGVRRDADADTLKKAFRSLQKKVVRTRIVEVAAATLDSVRSALLGRKRFARTRYPHPGAAKNRAVRVCSNYHRMWD